MSAFKPMKAPNELPDFSKLRYPIIGSPKLDGIRCVVRGGAALSSTLKPIPNKHIRETLMRQALDTLDGELMVPGGTFQDTTSAVMGREGAPDFTWNVFDVAGSPTDPFRARFAYLSTIVAQLPAHLRGVVKLVPHTLIKDENELALYEQTQLALGYEGIMLRDPEGPYKFGRSTLREGWLLKVKRFEDAEAIVIGFEQMMVNENEAQTNELGRTKRSSAKAGLVPFPALGAFVLRRMGESQPCPHCLARGDGTCPECLGSGLLAFRCGSGMNDGQKAEFWVKRARLMGSVVKYKHQPHGAKDAPRSPVFLGIRSKEDM